MERYKHVSDLQIFVLSNQMTLIGNICRRNTAEGDTLPVQQCKIAGFFDAMSDRMTQIEKRPLALTSDIR